MGQTEGQQGARAVGVVVEELHRFRHEHMPMRGTGPACRGCAGQGAIVTVHPATRLELIRDAGWPAVEAVPGQPTQLSVMGIRVTTDALVAPGDAVASPCIECDREARALQVAAQLRRAMGGR